jgi:hypothetical protein
VKRKLFLAIVAAIIAAAAFGLLIGLWWLVSYDVAGSMPHLLHSRLQANFAVLSILMIWIAFLCAALTWALAKQAQERPHKARHAFLRLRFHH